MSGPEGKGALDPPSVRCAWSRRSPAWHEAFPPASKEYSTVCLVPFVVKTDLGCQSCPILLKEVGALGTPGWRVTSYDQVGGIVRTQLP